MDLVEASVFPAHRMHALRAAHKSLSNGERQRDADGYRIRAAGVCLRGEKVLLVSAGKDTCKWVVPGGGVEKGEDVVAAAKRELEEEAGVRAERVEMLGVFQDDDRKHRTTVFLMREHVELSEWEDGKNIGRQRCWMTFEEAITKVKPTHVVILRAAAARDGIAYRNPRDEVGEEDDR